ncbi:MAG: SusC/RagA family TonB-linked outer membrane protein [Gemmatimonadales bacterium]|nr:MAG: SusC/RagA family TonB-linked outer membrane protein [Gemmatimonadales bacterium]
MIARLSAVSALAGLLLLLVAAPVQAQNATITGQVTSAQSGEPLSGVQVYLEGTGYNAVTGDNGRYSIPNVSPGTYTVVAAIIGFAQSRRANYQVQAGATETVDFALASQALRLQEVVVTGVSDPTEGIRTPFSVGRVSRDNLPVPARNPVSALQGRIAGARVVSGSGQPGSGASIRLRGRTSINTGSSPLIVVDGIIQSASTVDIDPQDIQDIEVVKGAAGASIYGSRAQNGVISITTRRGRDVGINTTRISARSEYGFSQMGNVPGPAMYHHWEVDANGNWVDYDGNPVGRTDRVVSQNRMLDEPYVGPTFNHLDLFFDPGTESRTTVNISRNMESTNFYVSFGDTREGGVVPKFNDGYQRQNFRMNLDHRIRSDLTIGLTSAYSRSARDNLNGPNPFFTLRFISPDVDLTQPNPDGEPYHIQPDPAQIEPNPLYALNTAEGFNYRSRTQGSAQLRYNPRSWVNLEAILAFDRSDRESFNFYPLGYKTMSASTLNDGQYGRSYNFDLGLNGSLTSTFTRSFGDMTARARLRYNFEREDAESMSATAREFRVRGVRNLNAGVQEFVGGSRVDTRAESGLANLGLDYAGKANLDLVVRQDGSSRFGPDARWNTYYRAAGSYLLNEEDWWPFESLTVFKPRYSIGTAGAVPGFSWQYETWSVGSAGPSKGTLGNRNLRPERTTEQEFGLDMIFQDRYSLELTHARTTTEDQLLSIPLPGVYGYSGQYQNAGTVESKVYEATFEASVINTADMSWNIGLIADRSRSVLAEFTRTCYTTSTFYRCEGEDFGNMYGRDFHRSTSTLAEVHAGSESQFQVNDDGYLVPVGDFNFTDGMSQNLWGTTVSIDGQNYAWGIPMLIRDEAGNPEFLQIGDANPNFNVGMTNTIRWRGLGFHTLLDAKVGGDVYNNTRQWPYRDNMSPDMVQAGKDEGLRKPIDYYSALYNTNSTNSHFVEDGSYLKLREMEMSYRFNRSQLEALPMGGLGLDNLQVSLIGRNLLTLTNFTGFDPEVGSGGAGGATENPLDSFGYPNFRSFTLGVSVDF